MLSVNKIAKICSDKGILPRCGFFTLLFYNDNAVEMYGGGDLAVNTNNNSAAGYLQHLEVALVYPVAQAFICTIRGCTLFYTNIK